MASVEFERRWAAFRTEHYDLNTPDGRRAFLGGWNAMHEQAEADYEPCTAEMHSWKVFKPEAVDSYWMRCHLLGDHDEHKNSETGAKWRDPAPDVSEEADRG